MTFAPQFVPRPAPVASFNPTDVLDIVREFSRHIMDNGTGRVRNKRRVVSNLITERFRMEDSSREVLVKCFRGGMNHQRRNVVTVSFIEHNDRFRTTTNTRQTMSTVRLEIDKNISMHLRQLSMSRVLPWLMTTEETIRPPDVKMPVRLDSMEPVDILMPAAFKIASVKMLADKSVPFYRMQSEDKECFYDIPAADWIFAKEPDEFAGSYVVTHLNGERLIIAYDVFHQQFMPVTWH